MNKKCQVFTPENYVRELLDSVGYTHNLYGKKILENSCGDGNILVAVVQRYIDDCKENGLSRTRIKNGLAKDIYGIEIDEEQYKKCIDNLDEVLKRNDIDKVDWKVINADYLKWNTTIKFQYIVGNPPYITYSELKEEEQLFVKLDAFLRFNDAEVLQDKGKVTAAIAKEFAESEFEKYRVIQDSLYESDFDKLMNDMENDGTTH